MDAFAGAVEVDRGKMNTKMTTTTTTTDDDIYASLGWMDDGFDI